MRVAVVVGPGKTGLLREFGEDGTGRGEFVRADDFAAVVTAYERSGDVRWVWARERCCLPRLLRAGVRVRRCHDVALTEALLLGRDGRPGEASSLAAAFARLRGAPVPRALPPRAGAGGGRLAGGAVRVRRIRGYPTARAQLDAVIAVHADQLRRVAADDHPARFGLLVAAESAGGLVAAEMRAAGMPWRADVHDALLARVARPQAVGWPAARHARRAGQQDLRGVRRPPGEP